MSGSANPRPAFKIIDFDIRNGTLQGLDEGGHWINASDCVPAGAATAMVKSEPADELATLYERREIADVLLEHAGRGDATAILMVHRITTEVLPHKKVKSGTITISPPPSTTHNTTTIPPPARPAAPIPVPAPAPPAPRLLMT